MQIITLFLLLTITTIHLHANIGLSQFEFQDTLAYNDHEFDAGSKIDSIVLDENKLRNLHSLGIVWGFLKYYHPGVAKGNYNWDYELFRILPKIIQVKDVKEADAILFSWIRNMGEFERGKKQKIASAQIKLKPDLNWIKELSFSNELKSLLLQVKNAKRTEDHFYVTLHPTGQANFKNENPYPDFKYPDTGYRLLSLFRYWNMIQYYFPYKYLIDENWKDSLKEFIPKFLDAGTEIEYKLAVLSLIERVDDTHANIWGFDFVLEDYKGIRFAPLQITFVEDKAVVTNCDRLQNSGSRIKNGDVIELVEGKTTEQIINERLALTPASNYPTKLRDIARDLLRTQKSSIEIQYWNGAERLTEKLKTIYISGADHPISSFSKRDTCFKMLTPEISYLFPGTIKNEYLPRIMPEVLKSKGLIIDFRCYPSAYMVFTLNEYLLPVEKSFVKFSKASISTPGLFTFRAEDLKAGKDNPDYYKGKIVILVNEETQSSAEFHTMAFRIAPKAKVIGSTTSAADGDVSRFYLPGGIWTMFSGIGVYYPDGTETQRIGIVPDIQVKPTIEGIKAGRDELLEKAIELINQ